MTTTCDTCGAPATHWVRDIQRSEDPGSAWMEWTPHGELRAGCDAHPKRSYSFGHDGKRLGALTDDAGRPIPHEPEKE